MINQQHKKEFISRQNNRAIADFEGLTPEQMHFVIYDLFNTESPIGIQTLSEQEINSMPLFNQCKYLIKRIKMEGAVKLTKNGFLPRKIVLDTYENCSLKEEIFEQGYGSLRSEKDSIGISLSRILLELSEAIETKKNKLIVSKKGEKLIENDSDLFYSLLENHLFSFNWSYLDNHEEDFGPIGVMGFGFSLFLLNKYGAEKRSESFYAEKYFKAFPSLLGTSPSKELVSIASSCYGLRTFRWLLKFYGLVDVENEYDMKNEIMVSTTELFHKLIHVKI